MTLLGEGFLMGVIATASVATGVLFLKYWRKTRDSLFLCFGAAFLLEGFNRVWLLTQSHPNDASPGYYLVRLFSFLIILAGILRKNYGQR